jgi:hypothetical protein
LAAALAAACAAALHHRVDDRRHRRLWHAPRNAPSPSRPLSPAPVRSLGRSRVPSGVQIGGGLQAVQLQVGREGGRWVGG